MKVLNCCNNDWANFSHDNANALRSVGIDCEDIKERPHSFEYKTHSLTIPFAKIVEKIKQADIVQIMHSDVAYLEVCKAYNKRVIVYHTGTNYRKGYKELNSVFNPYVEHSVIALGEFSGLGAKNEVYVVGAIDTDKLKPNIINSDFTRFAHYPSCEKTKGTDTIERVVNWAHEKNRNFYFNMSVQKVDYDFQLERIKKCDAYIELFAPEQDGKPYGSWGITALEAAAMGKIVITNHTTEQVYKNAYGIKTPFFVSNTEKELFDNIEKLSFMNRAELLKHKQNTRNWVLKNHSYQATGEKIKKLLCL